MRRAVKNSEILLKRGENNRAVLISFITAVLLITFCSKSSFLFPFNDWVDTNCFFTVGKSVMKGLVPYRDLIEQKGPLLYFVHTAASLLSYRSFIGLYFIEILSACFFIFYSYKLARLYADEEVIIFLPLFAAAVYSSPALAHGGSVEELLLPLFSYLLYKGFALVKYGTEISLKQAFFIGLGMGAVFWTKFNLLGIYVGALPLITYKYVKLKGVNPFIKNCLAALAGVFVISIPVLSYFLLNGALKDLVKVYFFDNVFSYGEYGESGGRLITNLASGIFSLIASMTISIIFLSLGNIYVFLKGGKAEKIHLVLQELFLLITVYGGGHYFLYYALAFAPFSVLGFADITQGLGTRISGWISLRKLTAMICFSVIFALVISPNAYMRGKSREELPQFQFAEIIEQKENPSLLNYGFLDGGFYTAAGIVPSCRAFCVLNNYPQKLRKMQDDYIADEKPDFIVCRNEKPEFVGYQIVAECSFYNEGIKTYYLYKRYN